MLRLMPYADYCHADAYAAAPRQRCHAATIDIAIRLYRQARHCHYAAAYAITLMPFTPPLRHALFC